MITTLTSFTITVIKKVFMQRGPHWSSDRKWSAPPTTLCNTRGATNALDALFVGIVAYVEGSSYETTRWYSSTVIYDVMYRQKIFQQVPTRSKISQNSSKSIWPCFPDDHDPDCHSQTLRPNVLILGAARQMGTI